MFTSRPDSYNPIAEVLKHYHLFTNSKGAGNSRSGHRFDGWSLCERNIEAIKAWMPIWEWFYRYYFRVETNGWQHMPSSGKVLLIGSHNGGLASPDTSMFMYDWFSRFGYERLAYGLLHPAAWFQPILAIPGAQVGAIMAHPKMARAALRKDAALLIYPGGAQDLFRPYSLRDRIHFAGHKGFIRLALQEKVTIVPLVSVGAHSTLIVLGDLYQQVKQLHEVGLPWKLDCGAGVFPVFLGLPWVIGLGPIPNFPLPVQIRTRVCAPIVFERYGRIAASDRAYVNACYQQVCNQMQAELNDLLRLSAIN